MNTRMARPLIAISFCCLLVVCAGAVSVTTDLDQIARGDTVSIDVQDLPDNATFTLLITGTFPVTPGGEFSFEAEDFRMPFSLTASRIRASLQNADLAAFAVKRGDVEVRKTGHSSGGTYAISESYNVSKGTYDFLKLSGTALPDTRSVTAYLELTGTKTGPDDGTISYIMQGFEYGTVEVTAVVDGQTVLNQQVTVLAPVSPTGTGGSGGYTGYGGGGGGGGGSVSTPEPTSMETTGTPTATETATVNMTTGTPLPATATPTAEETPLPTTPLSTPTKTAMSLLPLVGMVVASVFLAGRTRK